ncbi:MAG TPA: hypothetical protein VFC64_06015 [Atopostipes sp.]|nr:hypothetical protein [Atopostipes sp.]
MTNNTKFKKEVQIRKQTYQDKRVELFSRLCAETKQKDNRINMKQ